MKLQAPPWETHLGIKFASLLWLAPCSQSSFSVPTGPFANFPKQCETQRQRLKLHLILVLESKVYLWSFYLWNIWGYLENSYNINGKQLQECKWLKIKMCVWCRNRIRILQLNKGDRWGGMGGGYTQHTIYTCTNIFFCNTGPCRMNIHKENPKKKRSFKSWIRNFQSGRIHLCNDKLQGRFLQCYHREIFRFHSRLIKATDICSSPYSIMVRILKIDPLI